MARFAVLGYGPFQFRQLYEWMKLSRNLLYLCSVICCILIVSKLLQQLELWIEQQIKQDAENYPLQSSFPILYPWPQNKSANSLLNRSRSWRKGREGKKWCRVMVASNFATTTRGSMHWIEFESDNGQNRCSAPLLLSLRLHLRLWLRLSYDLPIIWSSVCLDFLSFAVRQNPLLIYS